MDNFIEKLLIKFLKQNNKLTAYYAISKHMNWESIKSHIFRYSTFNRLKLWFFINVNDKENLIYNLNEYEDFLFKEFLNKTSEELFLEFLKKHNVVDKFNYNEKNSKKITFDFIEDILQNKINIAFRWDSTKEGWEYWNGLHHKLCCYNNKIYENIFNIILNEIKNENKNE